MLCPSPALEVLAPWLLPTSPAATTHALGHTEGSLFMLKGPCVSLPAGPALASRLLAAKTHTATPAPHTGSRRVATLLGICPHLPQMGMASVAACWGFKCFGANALGFPRKATKLLRL